MNHIRMANLISVLVKNANYQYQSSLQGRELC